MALALAAQCVLVAAGAGLSGRAEPPPPPEAAIELRLIEPAPQPTTENAEPAPPGQALAQPPAPPAEPPPAEAAPAPPDPPLPRPPAAPVRSPVPAIRTRAALRSALARRDDPPAPALAPAAPAAGIAPTAEAPARPASSAQAETSLEGRILGAVQAALRVPAAARLMGLSGRAHVLLAYRDGAVTDARIEQSAGSALLDGAALSAVRDAAYPKPPPELAGRSLSLALWVRISVN